MERGIDINALDHNGLTAFDIACRNEKCSFEAVKFLVDNGADMTIVGREWMEPGFYYACKRFSLEEVKYLVDKGANLWDSGLLAACDRGHTKIGEFMIEKGASNFEGALTGCLGSENANLEMVKLLVSNGIDLRQAREQLLLPITLMSKSKEKNEQGIQWRLLCCKHGE